MEDADAPFGFRGNSLRSYADQSMVRGCCVNDRNNIPDSAVPEVLIIIYDIGGDGEKVQRMLRPCKLQQPEVDNSRVVMLL